MVRRLANEFMCIIATHWWKILAIIQPCLLSVTNGTIGTPDENGSFYSQRSFFTSSIGAIADTKIISRFSTDAMIYAWILISALSTRKPYAM